MINKHTVSPWNLSKSKDIGLGRAWTITGQVEGKYTGMNCPSECLLAEVYSIEANARLMATAPELLGALENIISVIEDWDNLFVNGRLPSEDEQGIHIIKEIETLEICKAVVAKATKS